MIHCDTPSVNLSVSRVFPRTSLKEDFFMSSNSFSLHSSKYWKYIHQMALCHDVPSLLSNRWFSGDLAHCFPPNQVVSNS